MVDVKTEVRAKKDCKFGYLGQMYVFKEGEKRVIPVPIEVIDPNSFEILSKGEERKIGKKKEEKKRGEE